MKMTTEAKMNRWPFTGLMASHEKQLWQSHKDGDDRDLKEDDDKVTKKITTKVLTITIDTGQHLQAL